MKRQRIAMTVGGVLVISAVSWSLATSFARGPELDMLQEQVDSLSSSLQEERAESRRARAERVTTTALPSAPPLPASRVVAPDSEGASGTDGGPAGGPIAGKVDRPGPATPTPREVGTELDEAFFTGEEKDHTWAREAESVAARKLRDLLPQGSELRSLQCRGSMCRIETIHADLATYQQFVQRAALDPTTHLWNGGMFSMVVDDARSPDGRLTTVAFIAREGEALPTPRAASSPIEPKSL